MSEGPAMAAAACVRSRVAGAAAAVGVGAVGCVAKGATTADQVNAAEMEMAARAVAILAARSAKGAHAARDWVAEAAAAAEEKEMEAEAAMTAAVAAAVGRAGMEAQVREAEVAAAGMAVAEAQTGTKRRPAPRRRLRTRRACRSPHASPLDERRSDQAPSWREVCVSQFTFHCILETSPLRSRCYNKKKAREGWGKGRRGVPQVDR